MAELNTVYGDNYQNESQQSKVNHVLNTIINNIAHRQFNFRLFDSIDLWDPTTHIIPRSSIETMIRKVKEINKQMQMIHLDKKSDQVNMLPELIVDSPVEYFMIVDGEYRKAYFIYITPYEVNAY
jgi:hypothetical protein